MAIKYIRLYESKDGRYAEQSICVDEGDYDRVKMHQWIQRIRNGKMSNPYTTIDGVPVGIGRFVLELEDGTGGRVHHLNGNYLNACRDNLHYTPRGMQYRNGKLIPQGNAAYVNSQAKSKKAKRSGSYAIEELTIVRYAVTVDGERVDESLFEDRDDAKLHLAEVLLDEI
jgi:hypothetical protein